MISKRLGWVLTLGFCFLGHQLFAVPGDLYVTSIDESAPANGEIVRISPDGTPHSFAGPIADPYGIVFDPSGNILVTSDPTNAIFKYGPDGQRTIFASGLNGPIEMHYDSMGDLFVASIRGNSVLKIPPGGSPSTYASGITSPLGIAIDAAGNVYTSSLNSKLITRIKPDGTKSTFASGLKGRIYSMVFDRAGNLLVAERDNGVISKFTSDGTRSIYLSGLNNPFGLLFDADGNLFVSEHDGGQITKVTPGGTRSVYASGLRFPAFIAIEPGTLVSAAPVNISSRVRVGTGDNVLIGGFIISGAGTKKIVARAIGPSLGAFGLAGTLPDPVLQISDSSGKTIAMNDSWRDTQQTELQAANLAPADDREAAVLLDLAAGEYTAIVSGKSQTEGVALVEIYDISPATDSHLANISSRGVVETGDNVMIGGFIIDSTGRVLVRGIGPSLSRFGVPNTLPDPTLSLINSNGDLIAFCNDWRESQEAAIEATNRAPQSDLEPAIVSTLARGGYTAVVRGQNGVTGVGLVEVYSVP